MKHPIIFLSLILFIRLVYSQQEVNITEHFEGSWLPSGWSAATFSESSTQNHTASGSKSAAYPFLGVLSSGNITSVPFSVLNGESFDTISFWLRRSSLLSLSGTLSVKLIGTATDVTLESISLSSLLNNTWTKYSYSYNVSADDDISLVLEISALISTGNLYLDDVRIHKSITLPVSMNYFTCSVNRNIVNLSWQTGWEINNSGFFIERQMAGLESWESAGHVTGSGNSSFPVNYTAVNIADKPGKYKYRLKQTDYNGNFEYYELNEIVVIKPPELTSLEQNYPNPSNPSAVICFTLQNAGYVKLEIFSITGQSLSVLIDEYKEGGYHSINFDGSNMASGIYFYRLSAENFSETKRLTLIK